MAPSLTPAQAAIIKSTVPVLAAHGVTITTKFYHNMLGEHPELNDVFNNAHQVSGNQPRALAGALYAYAANIDDLGKLSPALELICQKHASLYIRPEQYDIVGTHLLSTMKEVLGDALTPEIAEAWAAAYWQLADIMINREQQLYDSTDGWTDWRDFRIARKIKESEEITSFYLEPVDGRKLPGFRPGQYIAVRMEVAALKSLQARQYSLSDAPSEDYYRISVKREAGVDMADPKAPAHPGYVSNILHGEKKVGDVIEVSHPFGDFYLEESTAPLVLISAGVGLTPMMSMLNTVVAKDSSRQVSWIHTARNSAVRAFPAHIADIVKTRSNVHAVLFTTSPAEQDVLGVDYQHRGRMDLNMVDKEKDLFLEENEAEYYVCGPTQFMLDVEAKLKAYGVKPEKVHVELFGTGGVPRA
ncbi:globin-like protein [Lepidopterella palustris CBS 459.81]|uniref:nitric oxide dioxygenase n=1 Tax=Lepidopterella palustris CBS 459.81 TaxID=1314670 RepID=A0A8E2E5P6_9PEZI|nr:globin-like protein [Lepidopterella palustris CBS 459.81]